MGAGRYTNDFNVVVENRIWGKVENRITENLNITKETRHKYKATQPYIGEFSCLVPRELTGDTRLGFVRVV